MKKHFIPAAALTAVVALVSLGGLSSCKSDKAAKSGSEVETVTDTTDQDSTVQAPAAQVTLKEGVNLYSPEFYSNPENKSATPSDTTYVETSTGLKYVVLKEGNGESPKATDEVTVHYTGMLTDGTVFDSSLTRGIPATFPLNRVIPGWTEGLQTMKVGGKTIFYIPAELGYGEGGVSGTIPGNAPLIFEVDLLKVN